MSRAEPLVLTLADRALLAGAREAGELLERAAASAHPFAAVIVLPTVLRRLQLLTAAPQLITLAQRVGPALDHCVGLALVSTPELQHTYSGALTQLRARWDGPTLLTTNEPEALAWAREQLARGSASDS